jgi:hypothetical protein
MNPSTSCSTAVGSVDKAAQRLVGVGSLAALPPLVQKPFGARRILGRAADTGR